MFTNERYIINFFLMNESCISEWKSGEGGTLSKVERHCQSFFFQSYLFLYIKYIFNVAFTLCKFQEISIIFYLLIASMHIRVSF